MEKQQQQQQQSKQKKIQNPQKITTTIDQSNLITNTNTNVFSQLSAIYQQNRAIEEEDNISSKKSTNTITSVQSINPLIDKVDFPNEINTILQSLNKRSEITKLKALADLKKFIEDLPKNSEFLKLFLPTFLYKYKQIVSSEFHKKIIEDSNIILEAIILNNKKVIIANFKELFSFWFICMNEGNLEIASAANKAFESAFNKEFDAKLKKSLTVCQANILQTLFGFICMTYQEVKQENSSLNEDKVYFFF